MGLTSGGIIFRGRRKRNKAARLHPIAEDAASTTQLFNGATHWRTTPGEHRTAPPARRDRPPAEEIGAPRLRYEWRSATGEVLVVEAGLPEAATPTSTPAVSLQGVPLREAKGLDLRN